MIQINKFTTILWNKYHTFNTYTTQPKTPPRPSPSPSTSTNSPSKPTNTSKHQKYNNNNTNNNTQRIIQGIVTSNLVFPEEPKSKKGIVAIGKKHTPSLPTPPPKKPAFNNNNTPSNKPTSNQNPAPALPKNEVIEIMEEEKSETDVDFVLSSFTPQLERTLLGCFTQYSTVLQYKYPHIHLFIIDCYFEHYKICGQQYE